MSLEQPGTGEGIPGRGNSMGMDLLEDLPKLFWDSGIHAGSDG